MDKQEIRRSKNYYEFKVTVVTVLAALLTVLSFFLLRGVRTILGIDITLFGWLLRFFIVAVAVVAVAVANRQFQSKRYFFSGNKITVQNSGFGFLPGGSSRIVTLDPNKISSVFLNQTPIEKRYDVGTIVLELDTRSGKEKFKLEDIDRPEQVLNSIESYLQTASKQA